MKCPKCKREIEDHSKYCEYCGHKIDKAKWPLFVVFGIVAIGAVVGIVISNGNKNKEEMAREEQLFRNCVTAADYREYLSKYPDGEFAGLAYSKIIDLMNDSIAQVNDSEFGIERQEQAVRQNKIAGYEWLKGVWAGADGYGNFGRIIVTDDYFQIVNSNMDDPFDDVQKMERQCIELKTRPDHVTGEGDGEIFGFNEYIGVSESDHSIFLIQGEFSGISLHKIHEIDLETAIFAANHQYPRRVYSNAYDGFVNIREIPQGKAPILGVLRNGPEGAIFMGIEGEWTRIYLDGIYGYVLSKYVQDTPTEVFQVE